MQQIFAFVIILVVTQVINAEDVSVYESPLKNKNGVDIYFDYRGVCSNFAGICVNSDGCLERVSENTGRCPQSNAVCCKKPKVEIKSCQSQHDVCQESCGKGPTRKVDDCPSGMKCCVLI